MRQLLLSDGQFAQVDDQDYDACCKHSWTTTGRDRQHVMTYVLGKGPQGGKRLCIYLHQFIAERMELKIPPGHEIDHKDTNSLNNQRENLRAATRSEQRANQNVRRDNALGIKGVCLHKKSGRYQAEICMNKKRHFLGYHDTKEAAAAAYAAAAAKYHGEFARAQ